jgi:hypothetical protein
MRGRASTLVAVVLLVTVPWTAATAADPITETNCRSGEPQTDATACTAGEGHHQGTLVQHANERDRYELDPPPSSLVRITIEAEGEIEAQLVDPDGTTRSLGDNTFGPIELTAVSQPQGTWTLTIRRDGDGAATVGYAFDIAYEIHDHVASVQTEAGDAASAIASFPDEGFNHLELRYGTDQDAVAEQIAFLQLLRVELPSGEEGWFGRSLQGYGGYGAAPHVWTEGTPPSEVSLDLPNPTVDEGSITISIEADHGFEVAYGQALSLGHTELEGWAIWDGPDEASVDLSGDDPAAFERLDDFEDGEDGYGIQAGSFAYAENLTTTYEAPEDHATFFSVNSYTPAHAV